jgi:hypothetical protein
LIGDDPADVGEAYSLALVIAVLTGIRALVGTFRACLWIVGSASAPLGSAGSR